MNNIVTSAATLFATLFMSLIDHSDTTKRPDTTQCKIDCGCCCTLTLAEPETKRPSQKQLDEISRIIKTVSKEKMTPKMLQLERLILNHTDYFRCIQCGNVAGPGIYHGFRHPAMKDHPLTCEELIFKP